MPEMFARRHLFPQLIRRFRPFAILCPCQETQHAIACCIAKLACRHGIKGFVNGVEGFNRGEPIALFGNVIHGGIQQQRQSWLAFG
jgi:hypothetical protein